MVDSYRNSLDKLNTTLFRCIKRCKIQIFLSAPFVHLRAMLDDQFDSQNKLQFHDCYFAVIDHDFQNFCHIFRSDCISICATVFNISIPPAHGCIRQSRVWITFFNRCWVCTLFFAINTRRFCTFFCHFHQSSYVVGLTWNLDTCYLKVNSFASRDYFRHLWVSRATCWTMYIYIYI